MKKLIFAPLALAALFAMTNGMTGTPPAAAQPSAPEVGGCRYFCDPSPQPFLTRQACQAVCSTFCEAIC
jgi:hypothetical protein